MKTIKLEVTLSEYVELESLLVLAIGKDTQLLDSEFITSEVKQITLRDIEKNRSLLNKLRRFADNAK